MPNLVAISDFRGEIVIANKSDAAVSEGITWFINKYEPKFLNTLLGSDVATLFVNGLPIGGVTTVAGGVLVGGSGTLFKTMFKVGDTITVKGQTNQITAIGDDVNMTVKDVWNVNQDVGPYYGQQRWIDLLTPNGYDLKTAIANYIYYWYMRDQDTQTVGVGTVNSKAQNATVVSAANKVVRAWFEMVGIAWQMLRFLKTNASVYPEYTLPWWFNTFYLGWVNWDCASDVFYTDFYFGFYRRCSIPDIFITINGGGI